jgi:phosphoribosylformylglycinamidine synthase
MLHEIKDVIGISKITNVRIFNGYDIENVKNINKAKTAVFSEPGQDDVYDEPPNLNEAAFVFAITSAVGQYNQCEDSATLLLRLLEPKSEPVVRTFKQIALYGDLTEADLEIIKTYYVNPLEMREIPLSLTKAYEYSKPDKISTVDGFIKANDTELLELAKKFGIAMNIDDLNFCKDYFHKENRDPTVTEMKVLDTYWSDHCRHSTFMTTLENIQVEESKYNIGLKQAQELYEQAHQYVYGNVNRPLCLMDIATMQMKKQIKNGELADMELTDEVNACSINATAKIDGKPVDILVMFKNETHNHPTEIEPFGGAATCLGGGIRDPLSGRAFVYGAMRVTGSADPREAIKDTQQGKLSQRKITRTATDGYSSYGNQIGIASGYLNEYYDQGFKAKRLECGAIIGAVQKENITREKPKHGDVIVLVGGKTGRDGCGGATGSSKEQDEETLIKGGAEVQKGNPIIERNIIRLFRKPVVSKMIKKCNDFGAGGVSVAVGELADGININLDKVPVKYPGLDGTELAISESQERMAVVLDEKNLEAFIKEATLENLIAVKIAEVTDKNRIVMTWLGDTIVDMSSDFLNSGGIRQKANITVKAPIIHRHSVLDTESPTVHHHSAIDTQSLKQKWLNNLTDLNNCSQKIIADQFNFVAGGVTVFAPYGGKYKKTPEQGLAMRLPLIEGDTTFSTLMTVGYNPSLGCESPFHAAMYAVIESVTKIVTMGGDYQKIRLSFQEYFERLTTADSWGKPYSALMGAFLAQEKLGIPAIGGKDSMSGSYKDINVPPSLISFAVAVVDTTKLVSRAFKDTNSKVFMLKTPINDSSMPDFIILKQNMSAIYELVQTGVIKAASSIGHGGIARTISEMSFGNNIGFSFNPSFIDNLFVPQYGSIVLEVGSDINLDEQFILIGSTTKIPTIKIEKVSISLDEMLNVWEGVLKDVF